MYFVILTPDKVSGYCDGSSCAAGELRVVVSTEMYNMYDSRETYCLFIVADAFCSGVLEEVFLLLSVFLHVPHNLFPSCCP